MHLLYIFTFNYNLQSWKDSGILFRELEYFKLLCNKNIKITLVTYGDISEKELNLYDDINIFPIFQFTKKPKSKIYSIIKSFYYPFIIKKHLSFDIIKHNQLQGSWVALILKIISKKPLITRTGYDVVKFSVKNKVGKFKIFFYFLLTQLCLNLSNLYTVSSEDDFKFVSKKYKFNKKKLILRRNWVKILENNSKIEERITDTIVSVGRLENQKNYFQLIDYLKNSKFKLLIIGSGSLKQELLNYSYDNNVNLVIAEPVENLELLKCLDRYTFYISTSLFEGNPKATIEALGAGCIVFAPDSDNNKEIIENNVNGFIYNLNNENPINKLSALDKNELVRISDNSKNFILKEYSLKNFVENDIKELNLLLHGKFS